MKALGTDEGKALHAEYRQADPGVEQPVEKAAPETSNAQLLGDAILDGIERIAKEDGVSRDEAHRRFLRTPAGAIMNRGFRVAKGLRP